MSCWRIWRGDESFELLWLRFASFPKGGRSFHCEWPRESQDAKQKRDTRRHLGHALPKRVGPVELWTHVCNANRYTERSQGSAVLHQNVAVLAFSILSRMHDCFCWSRCVLCERWRVAFLEIKKIYCIYLTLFAKCAWFSDMGLGLNYCVLAFFL